MFNKTPKTTAVETTNISIFIIRTLLYKYIFTIIQKVSTINKPLYFREKKKTTNSTAHVVNDWSSSGAAGAPRQDASPASWPYSDRLALQRTPPRWPAADSCLSAATMKSSSLSHQSRSSCYGVQRAVSGSPVAADGQNARQRLSARPHLYYPNCRSGNRN